MLTGLDVRRSFVIVFFLAVIAWLVSSNRMTIFNKPHLMPIESENELEVPLPRTNITESSPVPVDESKAAVEMVKRVGGTVRIADNGHVLAINLTGCEVHDEDLVHLSATPQLILLNLDNTPVKDEGLRFVRNLPNLKILRFCRTKITDAGLRNLENLPELTTLHMDDSLITDDEMAHLVRFPKLSAAYVMGCSVTDRAEKCLPHCRVKR